MQYDIDLTWLETHYRKIQAEVHPDKFVTASPAERLHSMHTATLANEAYQTLKHPTTRAHYLLQLHGIQTLEDRNTAMATDFLMLQMEWREAIEEAEIAKDIPSLASQLTMMQTTARAIQQKLAFALADKNTFAKAAEMVRELSFIDKVSADVNTIIARLED